jgi:hypothetical protein
VTGLRSALGSAPARLGAYLVVVAAVFGAAYAGGAWAGPVAGDEPPARAHEATTEPGHGDGTAGTPDGDAGHGAAAAAEPAGLQLSQDGYTLRPAAVVLPAGRQVAFRFEVTGPDGGTVTRFRPTHEKALHLIAVRRDLASFQHVHPVMDGAGRWSVPLDLSAPGTYRVFADFAPAAASGDGHEAATLVLGTDVFVAGSFVPQAVPAPAASTVAGGYEVTLAGTPVAGRESELAFTVRRGGRPVTDLQPYLGAFGHLVSLRAGDLAYLHTHPAEEAHPGDAGGPEVRFATTFPTAGTYRLFLDFRAGDAVHTAAFTVAVPRKESS